MISTELLSRFNIARALFYASSPQVQDRGGHLVILDEHGEISDNVALLATPYSYDRLRKAIIDRPLSISLVELPDRPLAERYAIAERVSIYHAFMLT